MMSPVPEPSASRNLPVESSLLTLQSGLPIYESRSYDFTLETPLGDAKYLEEYEAVLPSVTPVS